MGLPALLDAIVTLAWGPVTIILLVIVGAVGGLRTIWTIADILNSLMAILNLIGLLALSGFVAKKLKDYNARRTAGKYD